MRVGVLLGGVVLCAVLELMLLRLHSIGMQDALRDPLLKLLGSVAVLLVGVLVTGLREFRLTRRPADPPPVDMLADLGAHGVREQWRKEAAERTLVTPAPIPVDWSLSELPVAGPVEAAVGDPDVTSVFPPPPGQPRVAERALVPVTAHGCDPAICSSVQEWLAARLAAAYPLFQHRGGQADAAALVAAGAVAHPRRARTSPPPLRWTQLLTDLREAPDSVLARGLSTPLALTLIRAPTGPATTSAACSPPTRWSTADG